MDQCFNAHGTIRRISIAMWLIDDDIRNVIVLYRALHSNRSKRCNYTSQSRSKPGEILGLVGAGSVNRLNTSWAPDQNAHRGCSNET